MRDLDLVERAGASGKRGAGVDGEWVISARIQPDGTDTFLVRIVAVPPKSKTLRVRVERVRAQDIAVRGLVMVRDLLSVAPPPSPEDRPENNESARFGVMSTLRSPGASAPPGAQAGTLSATSECQNGVCTQTKTTTDANGNVTGVVTSSPQPLTDFCQQNPRSAQCKAAAGGSGAASGAGGSGDGNSFGGTCAATTCNGDAIQCAIVQEQYKRDCENATVDPATQAKFDALASDGNPSASAGDTTISLASALPAAPTDACAVGDTSFTVGSGMFAATYAFPVGSLLCDKLTAIRSIIVMVGSVIFGLIVVGYKGS